MKKAVFGIIKTEDQAQRVVEHLQSSGFSPEAISIILPDTKRSSREFVEEDFAGDYETEKFQSTYKKGSVGHEKHSKAPEGGATGAVTGGIIGGSIGLLAGLGAIAIPGLGAFIAAGPVLGALSGSAIGGSVGLLVGWLVGLGIPEYEAKKYQDSVKAGNILICVHAENSEEVDIATKVLERNDVKDISNTTMKSGR